MQAYVSEVEKRNNPHVRHGRDMIVPALLGSQTVRWLIPPNLSTIVFGVAISGPPKRVHYELLSTINTHLYLLVDCGLPGRYRRR